MLKKIALLLTLAVMYINSAFAQCIPMTLSQDIYNLPCGVTCTALNFKVPDIRQTSDYIVKSIPYAPYAYTTPTGNEINSIYIDDQFSAAFNSPFPICFYGSTFNQFIVGSNGVLTFDAAVAGCKNAYKVSQPIPFEGAFSCSDIAGPRYPKFAIMGAYYDIDPSIISTSPNRKIEWRIEGTAPCRRLVVSFSEIPLFGTGCTSLLASQQIIVHEATGLVDIFIGNRPTCATWESGRGILGIQKDATTAIPVAGKNAVSWTESNSGYQFVPSGGASQLQSVQIIRGGAVIGTGTIGTSANGEVNVSFPSYCSVTNRDTLEIKAIYTSCADAAEVIYALDTVYVVRNPGDLLATATSTPATCTANDGTITVTIPPGAGTSPFQYSLNGPGGPFQASNVFTGLAAGSYTVYVKDNTGSCTSTINVQVGTNNPLVLNFTTTPTACPGVANGSITINPGSGTAPYSYQLDANPPQSSNTFTGLAAGTYLITLRDGNGCVRSTFVTVTDGTGLTATVAIVPTTCPGVNNGSITINPTNGTAPYTYQLGANPAQSGNSFTGLAAGTYNITLRDFNGCTRVFTLTVGAGAGLNVTYATTPASCSGAANGSITATPTNGTAPFTYQVDANAPQGSNVLSGLTAGVHSVTIRDFNGCTVTANVTVPTASGVVATTATTATTCAAALNGSITVNVTTGTPPYQYTLDTGTPQSGNIFSGVSSGPHSVTIRDFAGCVTVVSVTVPAGPGISATGASTAATCAAATNGTITMTVTVGSAPYQYALDAGAPQGSNIFNNVAPGAHNVTITDAAGCSRIVAVNVATGPGISATATATATSCNGATNGSITVTPSGGNAPYQYTLDAGAPQASNNFTGVAAGNHTVLVSDANNCTFTVNVTVAAGANLTGITSVTDIRCNGDNNGVVAVSPTNGNTPYQYALDGGIFQSSPIFNGLTPGNHTIQLRDGNNCTGTLTFTVNEPTLLTISNATTPVLCNGQANGSITVTAGGGTSPYRYSINGGALQPGNVFNLGAGTYNVTVTDANNCSVSAPATIIQPGNLQVSATGVNATCNGGANGLITATATGGSGGLQYSIDGTNFQPGNTFNVIGGTYTVTVKDANNCSATTTVTVGLTNDLVFSTRSDTTICESKSVTLTTTGNAISYAWTPGATLSDSTIQNPVATPTVTTQYIVTATRGLCSAKDTVIVTVNPAPVADAGPGITVCYGKTYQLQGSGGTQFFWRPANLLSDPRAQSPVANPRSTTVFYLKVSDANGCESLSEDTAKIIVTPPIVAYAGPDTTIVYNQAYQLNVATQTVLPAGTSYLWTPSFGLNNPNIANPLATLFNDQTYTVDVETPEGCKGNATVRLKVLKGPAIYVPDIFSPNGDGRNDKFYVVPVGIKEFDYLRIYNRWGQKVFETQLPSVGWEGRFRAQDQPAGVYIYTVQGKSDKGQVIFKKGSVLLVR